MIDDVMPSARDVTQPAGVSVPRISHRWTGLDWAGHRVTGARRFTPSPLK